MKLNDRERDFFKLLFDDKWTRESSWGKRNAWFFLGEWDSAIVNAWEDGVGGVGAKNIVGWKGIWVHGDWVSGTWLNGTWLGGQWNNGIWEDGEWLGGNWHSGIWKNGIWQEGRIWNPDSERYMDSNLPPNECKWSSSYRK